MVFRDVFFKNEVRNGFFVSSLMKRAWAAQLEVISEFDKVCRENDLRFFAAYGTLLGAVRHHGFIPWDDDVDVWMPRKDFEKFRKIADEVLPKGYKLLNMQNNEGYESYFDRLINSDSIDFNEKHMEKYHGFPFMCGLDIFPLDNLPINIKKGEFREDLNIIADVIRNLKADKNAKLNKRLRELLEKKYNCKIDTKKNIQNQLWRIYEKEVKKYDNKPSLEMASVYGWLSDDGLAKKTEWFEVEYMPFENIKVPVPAGYDNVLSAEYTDYMKIKISSKGLHDFPFYKKQEPYLFEKTNMTMTSFKFDDEDLREKDFDISSVRDDSLEKIELLRKINELIIGLIQAGNFEEVGNLLEQSQGLAIKIGEALEGAYDASVVSDSIKELENYCEYIYEMSEKMQSDFDGFVSSFELLIVSWGKIKDSVTSISNEHIRKIVFVIETLNDWKHYEGLYKILSNEPSINCMVMPVPYFYRNSQLKVDENKMIYDGEEIAREVDIIDYGTFDFNLEKVDCIIKSNFCDKHSFGEILHPFFHSEKLRKHCKNIIHIPTIDIMDFTKEDVQMDYMSSFFVKTPSVIYSDYILLKSEVNRNTYCDLLKEVTEEVDWNKKVLYCPDEEKMKQKILELI